MSTLHKDRLKSSLDSVASGHVLSQLMDLLLEANAGSIVLVKR